MSLERELSGVLKKICWEGERGNVSLSEVSELYFSAKEKYLLSDKEAKNQESRRLILKILFVVGGISEEFIEKWQSGKISPTDKDLELLKEGCNEVLEAFDNHFREELLDYQKEPYDVHYAETKEKIRKIRNLLDNR